MPSSTNFAITVFRKASTWRSLAGCFAVAAVPFIRSITHFPRQASFDRPLSGGVAVSKEPMQELLGFLSRER